MAGSLNKVLLIGNLGSDPEVRGQIVNLRLATTDTWRDKQSGERREKTEWHSVVIFNEALGKIAQQYLKKGSKVYIEGALQTRSWDDKNTGNKRYTTEVVLQNYNGQLTLLDGNGSAQVEAFQPIENRNSAPQRQISGQPPAKKYPVRQSHAETWDDVDDSIPFL